jgi:hypothetical protein
MIFFIGVPNWYKQKDSSTTLVYVHIQGGSNMTGINCDLFTHRQSRSYLNHLVSYDTKVCLWLQLWYMRRNKHNLTITYLLTYLLTPWSTVLPEKLKSPELLKKFPAFYGTRRFITAFTRARHLSLSWARLIQSMPPIVTRPNELSQVPEWINV